jgi:Fur family peroxide stress response transcriptional regulator
VESGVLTVNESEIERRLGEFERLCREEGLPLTVQRRDILRTVLEREDHPTADQIHEAVKGRIPGLSRTTVYRTLETLCDLGMLRRLHHPGATVRFDGKITRHHHLVCRVCHKVIDIDSKKFDDLQLPYRQRQGFVVEDFTVHFHGVCRECRERGED